MMQAFQLSQKLSALYSSASMMTYFVFSNWLKESLQHPLHKPLHGITVAISSIQSDRRTEYTEVFQKIENPGIKKTLLVRGKFETELN